MEFSQLAGEEECVRRARDFWRRAENFVQSDFRWVDEDSGATPASARETRALPLISFSGLTRRNCARTSAAGASLGGFRDLRLANEDLRGDAVRANYALLGGKYRVINLRSFCNRIRSEDRSSTPEGRNSRSNKF
jgi:hypothetical protein